MSTSLTKMILALLGFLLLIAAVFASVLYRADEVGIIRVPLIPRDGYAVRTEDEFMTDVVYRQPFGDSSAEASQSPSRFMQFANAFSATMVPGTLLGSFFKDHVVRFTPEYRASVPAFSSITSVNDASSVLTISEEAVVDSVDDRKTLGYTGQRKVAQNSEGSIIIGYRKLVGDSYQIFTSELKQITNDGYILELPLEPLSVRTLGITQRVPSLAFDAKDSLHIVWYGSDNEEYPSRRQIFHSNTKSSRNFWEENSLVSYVEGYLSEFEYWQEHPAIVMGEYDNVFVAWEGKDDDHDNQQIKFSRSLDGGSTWSDWINIHPFEGHTFSRPTLVYTEVDEMLHLFAYSAHTVANDSQQIQYTYSTDLGVTWSEWRVVSGGVHDTRHVSATIVNGSPLIAYREAQGEEQPTRVMYQEIHGDAIGEPRVLYESNWYQLFPSITSIEEGSAFCVSWMEENTASDVPNDDPTDGDIYFTCRSPLERTSPVYNLTPEGSHLYPNLPERVRGDVIPIVYYDDENENIVLRLIKLD